jgi:hypothetical protein
VSDIETAVKIYLATSNSIENSSSADDRHTFFAFLKTAVLASNVWRLLFCY